VAPRTTARRDVFGEARPRLLVQPLPDEVVGLGEHQRRDDQVISHVVDRRDGELMGGVTAVEKREDRPGVERRLDADGVSVGRSSSGALP
jgi:hypothetical protein